MAHALPKSCRLVSSCTVWLLQCWRSAHYTPNRNLLWPKIDLEGWLAENPCRESNLQLPSAHPVACMNWRHSPYTVTWQARDWLLVMRQGFSSGYNVSKLALLCQTWAEIDGDSSVFISCTRRCEVRLLLLLSIGLPVANAPDVLQPYGLLYYPWCSNSHDQSSSKRSWQSDVELNLIIFRRSNFHH